MTYDRLFAVSRTFRRYIIIGIAICLASWIATLIFYLTDVVAAGAVFFIWQLVYYGAPALCGVLVGFWIVTRMWIRKSPSPDDGSEDDGPGF